MCPGSGSCGVSGLPCTPAPTPRTARRRVLAGERERGKPARRHAPRYITRRENWPPLHTGNLDGADHTAERTGEDVFLRQFLMGVFPACLANQLILTLRANQVCSTLRDSGRQRDLAVLQVMGWQGVRQRPRDWTATTRSGGDLWPGPCHTSSTSLWVMVRHCPLLQIVLWLSKMCPQRLCISMRTAFGGVRGGRWRRQV